MHATATTMPPPRVRLRLGYLDGLRGLAALYVVIFHVSQLCHGYAETESTRYLATGDWAPGASSMVRSVVRLVHFVALGYGRFAVDVFIVLSGYVLMLPVARAQRNTVSGGFWTFMFRRARRILPPYYAMLVITLLIGLVVPAMHARDPSGPSYWDDCAPMFYVGPIVSHLLLVHTWTPWALRIDGPMWSVAVEFQIYILFPLLLLPIRKLIGTIPTAILFFTAGQVGYLFLKHALIARGMDPLGSSSPWFVGEFAIGMVAASLAFSGRRLEWIVYEKLPWLFLTGLFAAALVFFQLVDRKSWEHFHWLAPFRQSAWGSGWVTDLTVSLATMCLILHLTRKAVNGSAGLLLSFLDQKWAVRLGEFSYSLYLVHFPLINLFDLYFRKHFGPATTCILAYVVSLPAAVVLSYLFHLVFEKPFMSPVQKQLVPAIESLTMTMASSPALTA